MLRQLKTIIVVNVVLILFFVSSNIYVWNQFNSNGNALGFSRWSPFWVQNTLSGVFVDGNWVGIGGTTMFLNFPFWLFFVSTAVNLFLTVTLLRSKETKQNPS